MTSATEPEPRDSGLLAPRRPPLDPGSRSVGRTLLASGAALLACSLAAALLWSWSRRGDGVPLALVAGAAGSLALAFGFRALTTRWAAAAAVLEWGLIAVGLGVLFFFVPHSLNGDDLVRFQDIETLLNQGRLTNDPYSLVMPLVSVPVLELGHVVESNMWWAARFNTVVVIVGVLTALRLLRGHVEPQLARRAVLVLLFASMLTERLRDYNAEVLTATLVALGIIVITTGRSAVIGWAAIVIGVVNTPAAIVGLALVAAGEIVRTRRLRYLAPLAAAALLIMFEAWVRRGGPLVTGYAGNHGFRTIMPYSGLPGFSYPFLLGLAAILFSFGRGLLFFIPGLALWFSPRTRALVPCRRAMTMMLLFSAGLVLVYAKWWAWYGGLGWGPRFFVFAAVPAAVILAARIGAAGASLRADALTLGVLTLSAWVSCSGAIIDMLTVQGFCGSGNYQHEQLCWFTPDYSSLWQPVRQFPRLPTSMLLAGLFCGVVFAYLASPLVPGLLRALRPRALALARGWSL